MEEVEDLGIEFGSFDILSNNKIREWGRLYSNWPTYPQLFINGKLIGGVDVTKGLIEKGELIKMIPKEVIKPKPA